MNHPSSSSSYAALHDADRGGAAVPTSRNRTSQLLPLALVALFVLALSALLAGNPWSHSNEVVSETSPDAFPWSNEMLLWQRTGFHFQPESNWMNDPNAPMFYKGWYHLFYQYNPQSPLWGNITWGHAISRDLLHWFHLPLALLPDQWYDSAGVWSGSATILPDGHISILYTGGTNASTVVQVQNLATPADPSDPLLLHWIKSDSNPIILAPPDILPNDFRDPSTAWFDPSDSTWRIVIGSKDSDHAGIAIVYTTLDFVNYKLISGHLHRVASTGIWECIDMYPIATESTEGLDSSVAAGEGVKHVLKASTQDNMHDYYAIGTYEASTNEWRPDQEEMDVGIGLSYDWGNYYASKTFYDVSRQRRVLLGWIRETDSERTDILKGWASLQGIPRTVVFDVKTGSNLLQWPVEEVKSLRMTSKDFSGITLDSGSVLHLDVQYGTQFDVEAEFEIEATTLAGKFKSDAGYDCSTSKGAAERGALGPFGLLILTNQDLSEQTATYFYVNRGVDGRLRTHFCQDETRSSKATDIIKRVVGSPVPVLDGETLSLRILVDHSIVESFAQGGRSCITSRVYPTNAISNAARIYLFNNATSASVTAKSLKIWEMNSTFIQPYPFQF